MNENTPIRFRVATRYGQVGTVNSTLDFGVRDAYVRRGIAEWCGPPIAALSEPLAESMSRPFRRNKSKESV